MSRAFLFFGNLTGLMLAAYALYLVVRVRMYVGYAAAWLILIVAGLAALNLPPLWALLRWMTGAPDAQQAWILLIMAGMAFILVYFSVQLTILSKRVSDLACHIALEESPPERPEGKNDAAEGEKQGGG